MDVDLGRHSEWNQMGTCGRTSRAGGIPRLSSLDGILAQPLQSLARAPQGVEVLAEREPGVVLLDADGLLAVELQCESKPSSVQYRQRTQYGHTWLTGIANTPMSFAMKHDALRTRVSLSTSAE